MPKAYPEGVLYKAHTYMVWEGVSGVKHDSSTIRKKAGSHACLITTHI
jgi:hypothetical protein